MKTKDEKAERTSRIIARGEVSGHSHIVVGNATVRKGKHGELLIDVERGGAVIKHLIEKDYVEKGVETWTEEHKDIPLKEGSYEFIQEVEYEPYADTLRVVND